MATLTSPAYTIQDNKIVEETLGDFDFFIDTTTSPHGAGHKYYATQRNGMWVLAKWATWNGPEVVVREFASEEEANAAAEESYVYDILNNSDFVIFLDRAHAERVLLEILASEAHE